MKTNSIPPPAAPRTTRATGTHTTRAVESGVFGNDEPAATPSHEGGRDFASVLEEATRARSGSDNLSDNNLAGQLKDELAHDRAGGADQTDYRAASQSRAGEKTGARSSSSDEDDERHGDDSGERGHGFEALALPRETLLQRGEAVGTPLNARAILHVVDLERIVALVRTQIAPGGRHEITIELTRSTLEGLRIKLSRDASGRIDAEFIAASERVRAQLDARSGDLAELLRARGVQVGTLKTSIDAGTFGQGDGDERAFDGGPSESANVIKRTDSNGPDNTTTIAPGDAAAPEASPPMKSSTYRA